MSVSLMGVVLVPLVLVVAAVVVLVVLLRRRRPGTPPAGPAPRVPADERPPHTPRDGYQTGNGAHGASPWGNMPSGSRDVPPGMGL